MLLADSNILTQGVDYTFTYEHGAVAGKSDSWVQKNLAFNLSNFGSVMKVKRGWFSGRYVITVVPENNWTLEEWKDGFAYAWTAMNYAGTFIEAEGGSVSHAAGGVHQLVVDTVKGVAGTAGEAISGGLGAAFRNLAPWIALAAAAFLAYEYTKKKIV